MVKFPSILKTIYSKLFLFAEIVSGGRISNNIPRTFNQLYFESPNTWKNTFWLGTPLLKCPLDLWVFQEIIYELKPDLIVECGTNRGGSASYLATLCDLCDNWKIISIDIEDYQGKPEHPRVQYLLGSSTSDDIVSQIKTVINENDVVLVILDSDHRKKHVLEELRIYHNLVTKGSYLIVEDSNVNGHPVAPSFGPGPMEAIKEFLKENKKFKIDKTREKHYLTLNPNGYLKKIS